MLSVSYRQALRQARIRRILMDQEVVVQDGDRAANRMQDLPPPPPYVNLSFWILQLLLVNLNVHIL